MVFFGIDLASFGVLAGIVITSVEVIKLQFKLDGWKVKVAAIIVSSGVTLKTLPQPTGLMGWIDIIVIISLLVLVTSGGHEIRNTLIPGSTTTVTKSTTTPPPEEVTSSVSLTTPVKDNNKQDNI